MHPTSEVFTLDSVKGTFAVFGQLQPGKFVFNVTVVDHGKPSLNDTVPLCVIVEMSEGPPRFSFVGFLQEYNATILENEDRGTKVLRVNAISKDLITYNLFESNTTDFDVHPISGDITTTKRLDYENIKYYNFTVSATDHSGRMSVAHIKVIVKNVNDNRPKILNKIQNEIFCRISRYAEIGTTLLHIKVNDEDNDDFRFILLQTPSLSSQLFTISVLGYITTTGSLKDIKDNIYLKVTVMDNGRPSLNDSVTITVVVVNYGDSSVTMKADISEDTPVHTKIPLSLHMDKSYNPTSYTIIYPPRSPFTIDIFKGHITLARKVDYEKQQNYSLTVRSKGSTYEKDYDITINIKDANDNYPIFKTPTKDNDYDCDKRPTVKVHKDAKFGSVVYKFIASDVDSGLNGKIYYLIDTCEDCEHATHDCRYLFNLRRDTGVLTTIGISLSESKYKVCVKVHDNGPPEKSTRTCIVISAESLKPEFTKDEYHFNVDESENIGYKIGEVKANGYGLSVTYELRRPSK